MGDENNNNTSSGDAVTTTTTKPPPPAPSPEMNKRMGDILKAPGNQICADCPAQRPLWVSFLAGRVEKDRKLGVLCCTKCAQYHHFQLGSKRCLIKYLKMAHEFNMGDIVILESSGNAHVNAIFEAKLTFDDFDKTLVLPDDAAEAKRRAKFIKEKYKKCKYQDEVAYYQRMLELAAKPPQQQSDSTTTEEEEAPRKETLSNYDKRKNIRRVKNHRERRDSRHHRSSSSRGGGGLRSHHKKSLGRTLQDNNKEKKHDDSDEETVLTWSRGGNNNNNKSLGDDDNDNKSSRELGKRSVCSRDKSDRKLGGDHHRHHHHHHHHHQDRHHHHDGSPGDRRSRSMGLGSKLDDDDDHANKSSSRPADRRKDLRRTRSTSFGRAGDKEKHSSSRPSSTDRGNNNRSSRERRSSFGKSGSNRELKGLKPSGSSNRDLKSSDHHGGRDRRKDMSRAKSSNSFGRNNGSNEDLRSSSEFRSSDRSADRRKQFLRSRSMSFEKATSKTEGSTRQERSSSERRSRSMDLGGSIEDGEEKSAASHNPNQSTSAEAKNAGTGDRSAKKEGVYSNPKASETPEQSPDKEGSLSEKEQSEPPSPMADVVRSRTVCLDDSDKETEKKGEKSLDSGTYHGKTSSSSPSSAEDKRKAYQRSRSLSSGLGGDDREKSPSRAGLSPERNQVVSMADKRKQMQKQRSLRNSDKSLPKPSSPADKRSKSPDERITSNKIASVASRLQRSKSADHEDEPENKEVRRGITSKRMNLRRNRSMSPSRAPAMRPRSGTRSASRRQLMKDRAAEVKPPGEESEELKQSDIVSPKDVSPENSFNLHDSASIVWNRGKDGSPTSKRKVSQGNKKSLHDSAPIRFNGDLSDVEGLLDESDISSNPIWQNRRDSKSKDDAAVVASASGKPGRQFPKNSSRGKKSFHDSAPIPCLADLEGPKEDDGEDKSLQDWLSKGSPKQSKASLKKTVNKKPGRSFHDSAPLPFVAENKDSSNKTGLDDFLNKTGSKHSRTIPREDTKSPRTKKTVGDAPDSPVSPGRRSPRSTEKTVGATKGEPKSPRSSNKKSVESPRSPRSKKLFPSNAKRNKAVGRIARSMSCESLLKEKDKPEQKLNRSLHLLVDVDADKATDAVQKDKSNELVTSTA